MNYADYVDYLTRYLKREGDTDLILDLDQSIAAAEAKLTRDLRVPILTTVATVPLLMTDNFTTLPADLRSITLLVGEDGAPMGAVQPTELALWQQYAEARNLWVPQYARVGDQLRVAGPVGTGVTLSLDYMRKVPSYKTNDAQPYRDDLGYLDLYDAAVLSEVPLYLRDDERYGTFLSMYKEKLQSANDEAPQLQWGDAPLPSAMPEGIA